MRDNTNHVDILLTMYSSANNVYPMRRKRTGKEAAGMINQPHLTSLWHRNAESLLRIAVRTHVDQRLVRSADIIESASVAKAKNRMPVTFPNTFSKSPSGGPTTAPVRQLHDWSNPNQRSFRHARRRDRDRRTCDCKPKTNTTSRRCRQRSVGTTVWGRVSEQPRKLALIYAVSEIAAIPSSTLDLPSAGPSRSSSIKRGACCSWQSVSRCREPVPRRVLRSCSKKLREVA